MSVSKRCSARVFRGLGASFLLVMGLAACRALDPGTPEVTGPENAQESSDTGLADPDRGEPSQPDAAGRTDTGALGWTRGSLPIGTYWYSIVEANFKMGYARIKVDRHGSARRIEFRSRRLNSQDGSLGVGNVWVSMDKDNRLIGTVHHGADPARQVHTRVSNGRIFRWIGEADDAPPEVNPAKLWVDQGPLDTITVPKSALGLFAGMVPREFGRSVPVSALDETTGAVVYGGILHVAGRSEGMFGDSMVNVWIVNYLINTRIIKTYRVDDMGRLLDVTDRVGNCSGESWVLEQDMKRVLGQLPKGFEVAEEDRELAEAAQLANEAQAPHSGE